MKISNNIVTNNKIVNNNLNNNDNGKSFKNILSEELLTNSEVRFSKHANKRLNSRDINLSPKQINRVKEGIKIAKEKGIKDTLIIVDNVALVVNAEKNVIITALNSQKQNVINNIDGAVIV